MAFPLGVVAYNLSQAKLEYIETGPRQRLIFEHGFWNFGYGYECLGYSVFGFGFRLQKNDEFYWNSWP